MVDMYIASALRLPIEPDAGCAVEGAFVESIPGLLVGETDAQPPPAVRLGEYLPADRRQPLSTTDRLLARQCRLLQQVLDELRARGPA